MIINKLIGSVWVLIVLASTFFSSDVSAKKNYINFIGLEVAPWAYYDENTGLLEGVFPDVIEEFERRIGKNIKVSLSEYAFTRINRELKSGRQDCTMIVAGARRDEFTLRGEKVFDLPIGIIARKEIKVDDPDDLKYLKTSLLSILSTRKDLLGAELLDRQIDPTYEAGIKKLKHGRVDAIAGAIPTIKYLAVKYEIDGLLGSPYILANQPIYLQCSKGSKHLKLFDKMSDSIRGMREDGTLKSIVKKHSWY